MSKRYLEDIVEEERGLQTRGFVDKLKEFPTNLILEHPFVTSVTAFLTGYYTLDYVQRNYPQYTTPADYEALMFSAYTTYTLLGLFKEYVLERRSPRLKNKSLYKWFLGNPKIAGIMGAVAGAYICYKGEQNIQDLLSQNDTIRLANKIVAGSLFGGALTEIISRGLKNLGRIKKSIKKLKTSTIEKLWNIPFEHPFIASAITTIVTFNIVYNHPASRVAPLSTENGRAFVLKGKLLEDIVENPGRIGDLFLQSSLVGMATLTGALVGGSILHSHSLRELGLRTAKLYNEFSGKKDQTIDYQKRLLQLPNSIERTIENLVELGNLYYGNNDRENAFRCYRKAIGLFSKKQDHISYSDFFRKTFKLDKLARKIKSFFYKKDDEKSDINRIFIDLLNKDGKALIRLRNLAEEKQNNPEYVYLYGKALEIFGYRESGRAQKELAVRKIKALAKELEEQGTKNTILRLEHEVFRAEVIGKHAPLENLLREQEATKELRRILEQHEKYDVPVPIGIIDDNYYMEYASGDTLEKRLDNAEILIDVADFLGLFHARFNLQNYETRPRIYEERIRDGLVFANIDVTLIARILYNIQPLTRSLQNIKLVYNKDAHLRNWIVDDFEDITAIDIEVDSLVPIVIDSANLLDLYDVEDKRRILDQHLLGYEKYSGTKLDRNQYYFAYLNAVVIRALEIYPRVRNKLPGVKETFLNNALNAIDRIRQDFSVEYKREEIAYQNLSQAIEELRSI